MPLPAYLLATPTTNPTQIFVRKVKDLGVEIDVIRSGQTLTVRNLELSSDNAPQIRRAIQMLVTHADLHTLSIDAIVYPIQGNIISRYEAAGFLIHLQPEDESDEDAYTLLRRAARS